jgi:cyclophilin family peptidyl-prolyl cis-trans isomerase
MGDRFGKVGPQASRMSRGNATRRRRRVSRQPVAEILEDRRLLTASLQPIANFSVPAQQGYTLPLNGSGTTDDQTFTVTQTSGSSDIAASVAQGNFWTIDAQYTDPTNSANNFSGALTFQLFQALTPNTVAEIEEFTNDGYYNGKNFTRVANGFPAVSDYIIQGGAPNANGTGNSGQPGTPFLNENVQQLAFTGQDQLAMANAGVNTNSANYTQGINTNDTQFFITTSGSPNSGLGYSYTIFGQMVSGLTTLAKMTQIPVEANPNLGDEDSEPVNPLVMSSVSLSAGNPNGVLVIDTTQATAGESATFMVTAHDATDNTSVSQSFTVTVGAYAGPDDPAIDFRPLAGPVAATATAGSPTTITLTGQNGYPYPGYSGTLSYSLVSQPKYGTISNFDTSTGTFDYTPNPGASGTDTFQYQVQELGPAPPIGTSGGNYLFGPSATTTSNAATVTVTLPPETLAPTISWASPAAIIYGTALGSAQLDATASVPGNFTYSPAPGTVLKAGNNQTLSVSFTPTDTTDYTTANFTTTINVAKAAPTITWANPASLVSGTPLGGTQLDAVASWMVGGVSVSVPGTFTYAPALGTILATGNGQSLSVGFTPSDTSDYTVANGSATINITPTPTPTSTPTPTPLVTVTGIQLEENKKHQVTEVLVTFSGAVNVGEADSTATYRLATAGKKGSFTAKNAQIIKLRSASYNAADDTIALIPKKPFALSKAVQLLVDGDAPSGLQDSQGRYIDGNHDGQAGGNAVAILSRSGVNIDAMAMGTPSVQSISAANAIDVLLARSALDGLVHHPAARKHRD